MRPWKAATIAASASMCAGVSSPRASMRLASASCAKFAHLHRVLESRARRRRSPGASTLPVIGHDIEIQRGREPAIEPQFLLAVEPPRRERGEIEEARARRAS